MFFEKFFKKCEPTNLEHINDSYSLDWKFGENSVADAYRAYDKLHKRHCALWITRERLSEQDRVSFYEHTRYLRKGGLERVSRYGCDIDGVGYVALPVLAVKRLDYDAPDPIVKARRLLLSILKVEAFHIQGIVCGNLCTDSFMIDSEDVVHFVGYAGGELEKKTKDLPAEYLTFVPPEEVEAPYLTQASDVYALAVIGLKLFGVSFPGGVISPERIPEYLRELDPKAPLWLQAVLPRVISSKPGARFKTAGELLAAISVQAERQRELPSDSIELGASSHDMRGEADVVLKLPRALAQRRAQLRRFVGSPSFVIRSISLVLVIINAGLWFAGPYLGGGSYSGSESASVKLAAEFGRLGEGEPSGPTNLRSGLRALFDGSEYKTDRLDAGRPAAVGVPAKPSEQKDSSEEKRGDPIVAASANAAASRAQKFDAQLRGQLGRAKGAGFTHTAEVLGYLVSTPNTIRPGDITRLFQVLDTTTTREQRRDLVAAYESVDPDLAYMLGAALSLDLAEPTLFRELLVRGAKKQIGVERGPLEPISTGALIASIPSSREFFLEDVSTGPLAISDDEVWWLLETLILQRADQLRSFLASQRVTQLNLGLRRFFLQSIERVNDIDVAPIAALLRSLRNSPDPADIQKFSQWYDPASVQVLLAALLISSQPEVVERAFDALASKSTGNPSVDEAIAYIRSNADALRVYYASFVAGVGLVDVLSEEERRQAFSSIRGKPQASKLCKLLLQKGSPSLVVAILENVGDTINPALLVDLLKHPDKSVRLKIIPFVRDVSLSSTWQQVIDAYLTEEDPDVKARYESEIPRIRGS